MNALKILEPGPFTTVQDRGRFGFQHFGVPPCGMLDSWAGDLANFLVGNTTDKAVLEWTYMGGRIEALCTFDMAITGGDMPLMINGIPRKTWASHRVNPGDIIQLGGVQSGCRTYFALTGGIDVPLVMGSRSTYIGARLGGYNGRILAQGDLLPRGNGSPLNRPRTLPDEWIPRYGTEPPLRVILGPQDDYFDRGTETFLSSPFTVTHNSNRMGYRLRGPSIERIKGMPKSILSEPSLPGGVQIPEDGQPIILLSEQTTGGYAKIATVISSDISKLAQAGPGNQIRFEAITLKQAHELYRKQAERFRECSMASLGSAILETLGKDGLYDPDFI